MKLHESCRLGLIWLTIRHPSDCGEAQELNKRNESTSYQHSLLEPFRNFSMLVMDPYKTPGQHCRPSHS